MIIAVLLVLAALIWLPLTAAVLIIGSCCALWLIDQMFGAPLAGAPEVAPPADRWGPSS